MRRTRILVMSSIIVVLGLALITVLGRSGGGGSANPVASAQHAAETQGYSDLVYRGFDMVACGADQPAGFAFEATNPVGTRVTIVLCNPQGAIAPTSGWRIVTR